MSASFHEFHPISDVGSHPALCSHQGGSKGTNPTDTFGNTQVYCNKIWHYKLKREERWRI
jgi:hypothetical protein